MDSKLSTGYEVYKFNMDKAEDGWVPTGLRFTTEVEALQEIDHLLHETHPHAGKPRKFFFYPQPFGVCTDDLDPFDDDWVI